MAPRDLLEDVDGAGGDKDAKRDFSAYFQPRLGSWPAQVRVKLRAGGNSDGMNTAGAIVLVLLLLVPAVFVGGLFVWAARKDGQADKALQARLGIRRRTRLGR